MKVGSIVFTRWFVPGYPVGITTDTRLVVREVRKRDERIRVERDDGREGSWWLDFSAVLKQGDVA